VAAEVGIDKASVSRILSVLKLPDDVQAQVNAGEIAPSAAYEISRIPSAEKQREMAGQAAAGRLTQKAAADQARQSLPIEKHRRRTGQPLTLTYRHDAGLKITVRIEAGARRKLVENWQELAVEIEADLRQKSGRRMAA